MIMSGLEFNQFYIVHVIRAYKQTATRKLKRTLTFQLQVINM